MSRQANYEVECGRNYVAAALWFCQRDLCGLAAWCKQGAREEWKHAQAVWDYLHVRGGKGFQAAQAPLNHDELFHSAADVFDHCRLILHAGLLRTDVPCAAVLKIEQSAERKIYELLDAARSANDFGTVRFYENGSCSYL
jgi:ferritin